MQKRTLVSVLVLSVVLLAGITWVYAQQSGRSDSLTTQDHIDIQQLYARYYQTIDAGDAEGWAGTFTSDGVFNNVKGHDALAEFIRRAGQTGLFVTYIRISLLLRCRRARLEVFTSYRSMSKQGH